MAKRDVVFAARAVWSDYWQRPFEEVMDAARSGATGLRVETQETDKSGHWPIHRDSYDNKSNEAIFIRSESGGCELYQQGWIDETFVPRYAVGE